MVEFVAGRRDFHLLLNTQACSGTHPAFYYMGTVAISPGGGGGGQNRQRRDAGHLRPSSTKIKWSYTSTPRICLHGMQR